MLTRLRTALLERTERFIQSSRMIPSIAIVSLLESTIVPIPLETLLIPLMQKRREAIWQIATAAMIGCLLGAMLGYAIGAVVFEISKELMYQYWVTPEQFANIRQQMLDNGFWFIVSTGFTPVPLQLAMLAAGATGYGFVLYLIAVFIGRAVRYYGLALLVFYFGNQTERFIRRHQRTAILAVVFLVLLVTLYYGYTQDVI